MKVIKTETNYTVTVSVGTMVKIGFFFGWGVAVLIASVELLEKLITWIFR